MKINRTSLCTPLLATALVGLSGSALADTIFRTDGKPLEDVKIKKESLTEVEYTAGKDRATIATDKVVDIEYDKLPKLIDAAEDLLRGEDVGGAIDQLESYLEAVAEKGDRIYDWGPAYAMRRLIELRGSAGDFTGVVKAADRLIESAPDSRHVPFAYLTKAQALRQKKDDAKAKAALQGLLGIVESKALSDRWRLAAEVELARIDQQGDGLRSELTRIADAAGDYPTVKARAELAQAEAYIDGKEFAAAKKLLQDTLKGGTADDQTMAGARTGLGDCLFQQAVDEFKAGKQQEAEKLLQEALLNYMRVVVSYPDEAGYVAKSMFYAGRSFDQFQDEDSKARAQRMYVSVMRRFEGSSWATEAKHFRR
jgi:TolA-binding protein